MTYDEVYKNYEWWKAFALRVIAYQLDAKRVVKE